MNKSVIFGTTRGVSFLVLCLVPLILLAHCAPAQAGDEQSVTISVEKTDLTKDHADLRYSLPYAYSIEVSPWMVRIFEAHSKMEPTRITWKSSQRFEIIFIGPHHFAQDKVKAEEEKDSEWIARSGPLTKFEKPRNGRYRYQIKIWPELPTARDGEKKDEYAELIKRRREEYYILIDPDYIIEDKP